MGGHSEKKIMDLINSTEVLLDKWNDLKSKQIASLHQEFYSAFGASIPGILTPGYVSVAQNVDAIYATNADVSEYKAAAATLLSDAFKSDWAAVALDVVETVGTIVEKVYGKGVLSFNWEANGHTVDAKKSGGTEERTYVVCVLASVIECSASDWIRDTTFYASTYAFAVWQPHPTQMGLMKKKKAFLAS